MYLTETTRTGANGTSYRCVLLRQASREGGQGKNRTLATLSHCTPQEVAAIRLALPYKDDLPALSPLKDATEMQEGRSIGAVWVIYAAARRLGIETALGTDCAGKLALWQVLARVIDHGSRLSAVRLAQTHAACEVWQFSRGFDATELYDNLVWLGDQQATIERRWCTARRGVCKPALCLYDVTRSDLEGPCTAWAAFGSNREGKAGQTQVVLGLLCDEEGAPVSTDVFAGHTSDLQTLAPQIAKVARRFGCERVTCVGDRGLIKSGQIAALARAGFHYLTALTKPQIARLLKAGGLQLGLFTAPGCEVAPEGLRSLVRRHPRRAEEVAAGRRDTQRVVEQWVAQKNGYLHDHRRAQVSVALRAVQRQRKRLQSAGWLTGEAAGRTLRVTAAVAAQQEAAKLDGCYVLTTDRPRTVADTGGVHERYKDLAVVEQAFRTCKTAHLEVRPVYVRTAASTRGHVLMVLLAYALIRELQRAWGHLDLTVEEGISHLATVCAMAMRVQGQEPFCRLPKPRESAQRLLEAVGTHLPDALPQRKVRVVTRTQLPSRRKKRKNTDTYPPTRS